MDLKKLIPTFGTRKKTPPKPFAKRRTGEFAEAEKRIGHVFDDEELLQEALTHPSYKVVSPTARDYQRLEFLGDAVLGLVIAETLYDSHAGADEGRLSGARSQIACGKNLAAAARALGLGTLLRTAGGGDAERIRETDTAHEDALEAIFGALYLDSGLDAARALAKKIFGDTLAATPATHLPANNTTSPKNRLQELVQQRRRTNGARLIEYRTTAEDGPAHAKQFTVEVAVAGEVLGKGVACSKKAASENAAAAALEVLEKSSD